MVDDKRSKSDKLNQELELRFDDVEVEVEVLNVQDLVSHDPRFDITRQDIYQIMQLLEHNYSLEAELNMKLDPFNDGLDKLDYTVSIGSGLLAGIIDSVWVGSFDYSRGREWGKEEVNSFVIKAANRGGYKGSNLKESIKYLEQNYGLASDKVMSYFGGTLQHHIRDFTHHPNIVGLCFSILTQFTGHAYGTNTEGRFTNVKILDSEWIGKDVPQKILFGTVNWFFHMASDMAGSSNTPGGGTGLPGPILSLLKEISSLPIFGNLKNDNDIRQMSVWLSRLFNGTMLAKHDQNGKIIYDSARSMRFDLRAEIGVAYELNRQAQPVLINEVLVRSFYFLRLLKQEISEKNIQSLRELQKIDLNKVKPSKSKKLMRMLTISRGVMSSIDVASAILQALIKNGKIDEGFFKDLFLRVNVIGVGMFLVSIGSELSSSSAKRDLMVEKITLLGERTQLVNGLVNLKQAEVWISARVTASEIQDMVYEISQLAVENLQIMNDGYNALITIGNHVDSISIINQEVMDDLNLLFEGESSNE